MEKIFLLMVLFLSAFGNGRQEKIVDSVCSITADYSTLDLTQQDFTVVMELSAFSDAACENELILKEIFSAENEITYQLEQDAATETVYIIPPVISVTKKVEKTILDLPEERDVQSDEFQIKDMFVQKGRDSYEVRVIITSRTGQYPNNLMMVSGERIYPSKRRVDISSSDADRLTISEYSFGFEVSSDEALALEILDNAHFTYNQISHFEVANDWSYSCEDTELQIINTTLD